MDSGVPYEIFEQILEDLAIGNWLFEIILSNDKNSWVNLIQSNRNEGRNFEESLIPKRIETECLNTFKFSLNQTKDDSLQFSVNTFPFFKNLSGFRGRKPVHLLNSSYNRIDKNSWVNLIQSNRNQGRNFEEYSSLHRISRIADTGSSGGGEF